MAEKIIGAHECTSKPSLEPRTLHSHDDYEVYYLISGDADFLVEGSCYHLLPGDLLLMRKGEVHMFRLRSAAPYERMHVNFDISEILSSMEQNRVLTPFLDRPLGKLNHYPASLFPQNHWKQDLERICHAEEESRVLYLLPLLGELKEEFETIRSSPTATVPERAAQIASYINAHLTEDLSLDELSSRFYMSETHLNRIFKHSTGATVWKYITIKRLFLAKEMLAAGRKPTEVAPLCGFKDYTTFFRAYKKQFGSSPKQDY